ncbi:MAG: inositol monophosphatase family protein [Rhodothermales bacterium]
MRSTSEARTYERAREVAVDAAWQAARVIRTHAGRLREADVRHKGVHDLVTNVDEASQALITRLLHDAYPDDAVLAEEGADPTAFAEGADGYRWIIDPIDGTTNFTHGLPPYAVSIALQQGTEVVLGVGLEVAHEELFTAIRGSGTYRNGVRVRVSRRPTLDCSLLATGFPYRAFGHVDSYLKVFRRFMQQTRGVRRLGAAAIDLAYVACGRFDGFFETGLNAWDVAAGTLLVEEAGGRVTDYQNAPNPLFKKQILATNGPLHEAMLDILAPMREVFA